MHVCDNLPRSTSVEASPLVHNMACENSLSTILTTTGLKFSDSLLNSRHVTM